MDISEKKIEEIANEVFLALDEATGQDITGKVLKAANITGKDGLLEVLEGVVKILSASGDLSWADKTNLRSILQYELSKWKEPTFHSGGRNEC